MPKKHITVPSRNLEELETYSEASYVGESEGHWYLIEVYYDSTCSYNMYDMASDYSGWFVKYRVDLSAISYVFPEIIKQRYVTCLVYFHLWGGGRRRCLFMVFEIPGGKIVHYNLVDRSVEKLWELAPLGYKIYTENHLRNVCALPFIESLAFMR